MTGTKFIYIVTFTALGDESMGCITHLIKSRLSKQHTWLKVVGEVTNIRQGSRQNSLLSRQLCRTWSVDTAGKSTPHLESGTF